MAQSCSHCGQAHPSQAVVCPVTGARISRYTLVNEDEILVGSVVGERYHVRDVLGQGTTGTVFAVEHLGFPRAAAMKVLRPRYVPAESLVRVFHAEARSAFTVSHPCLAEIFDVGQLPDGAPYFVTERLQGQTLAARLKRDRLSLAAGVDVMMQLLSAIETIHARDLLLRDLRPQNIYLAHRRGCRPLVKILDFGLARLVPLEKVQEEWDSLRGVEGANDATGALSVPYYLSPERARSEHDIEQVSDLFVAAAIFYESLTGQKPFASTSFNGLLLSIAQATPVPLAELRPEVPEELDELVMRTLSGNPRSRPASARELQDELRAIFDTARRGSKDSKEMRAAPSMSMPLSAPMTSAPATQASKSDRTLERVAPAPRRQSTPSFTLTAEHPSGPRDSVSDDRTLDGEVGVDPIYEEEQTRADRRYEDLQALARRELARFDEASAENPARTVPPPGADPGIDIQVELDAPEETTATTRADELDDEVRAFRAARAAQAAADKAANYEEETETMQMSPELRARIDQLGVPPVEAVAPPQTSRSRPKR